MNAEIKEKAVAAFTKNPYWKRVYDNAPTFAKSYKEIVFALSEGLIGSEEAKRELTALYPKLTTSDWDYLIENCGNAQGKFALKKTREKYANP